MATVAGADSTKPSETVKVNASEPLTFAVGIYVKREPPASDPSEGGATMVYVRASPSGSEPESVRAIPTSSDVTRDWPIAVGGSLTGETVMATTPVAEWVPS